MLRSLPVIVLITLLIPAMVYAQDDDLPLLTETATVTDYDLDFQHPADWEIIGQGGASVMFSVPIAGTGAPNPNGIGIETGGMVATWTFEAAEKSVEEVAVASAEAFLDGDETFEMSEPQSLTINGRVAVQVDIDTFVFLQRYISMEINGEAIVTVWVVGSFEQIDVATPIIHEMLATIRPSGDPVPESRAVVRPELTQHYTRQADQTSFSAPADWLIEETPSYTLLTAPNGVTVGISSETVPGADDIVLDTIAFISESLKQQVPGVELDPVEEFEVNSQRAARVSGMDNGMSFAFWSLDLGGDIVGHISVIGPPDDVREVDATVFAIAETMTTGLNTPSLDDLSLSASIASEDGTFTISYPEQWSALATGDFVTFTDGNGNLTSDGFQETELLVVVQKGLDFIVLGTGITVPEAADPSTIARTIVQNAEENGYPQNIEKLSINDRTASLLQGSEGSQERFVLIFTLPDGSLASMTAITPVGYLEGLRDVLLEIATSMSPR